MNRPCAAAMWPFCQMTLTTCPDYQLAGCSKSEAEQCIMMAAKIISPVVESSYTAGYNWCIEQVKSSQYMELAHSLDIDKAIGFLKQKDFQQVGVV